MVKTFDISSKPAVIWVSKLCCAITHESAGMSDFCLAISSLSCLTVDEAAIPMESLISEGPLILRVNLSVGSASAMFPQLCKKSVSMDFSE